jgi:hypothetical protein
MSGGSIRQKSYPPPSAARTPPVFALARLLRACYPQFRAAPNFAHTIELSQHLPIFASELKDHLMVLATKVFSALILHLRH